MNNFDLTFEENGIKYGVDNEYEDKFRTYILDENDVPKAVGDTSDTQDWPVFYALGWTKAELHQDFKNEWREAIEAFKVERDSEFLD